MWWHTSRNQISSSCEKGLVHLNRWGRQFSRLLAAEVCASAVVMVVESSWNVMAHSDAREGKWRGNKRMEWITSKRHMTAERRLARAVQTLQADVHSSPASSRLNWRLRRFKWTSLFRRKTKSGFCACAITFQKQSNTGYTTFRRSVKIIVYPLHSLVSPSLPLQCVTVCQHISTVLYDRT